MVQYDIDLGLDISSVDDEPMVKSTVSVVAQKEEFCQARKWLSLYGMRRLFKHAFIFRQHWKVLHKATIELYQCPD